MLYFDEGEQVEKYVYNAWDGELKKEKDSNIQEEVVENIDSPAKIDYKEKIIKIHKKIAGKGYEDLISYLLIHEGLRALRYLHLSKNPFEELPPEIGSLDLLDLSLNGLHLENIPEFVFRLSKLKRLYVNRCLLSQFPFELREINNLELLAISGNRFVLGDCPGMVPNYIDGCLDWSVERRNKTKIIKVY